MKALQKKGYNEKEILNTKKKLTKLKDLEFLKSCPLKIVRLQAKERWYNTWHQKRQMKPKESVCIMKLRMQEQHHRICHKHRPYSNYKPKGSICQASSMLATLHNILMVLDLWALWQWMILIIYWVNCKVSPQFINFSLILTTTAFIFEQ